MSRGTFVDYNGSFLHSMVMDSFLYLGEARISTIIVVNDEVTEVHLEDEEDFSFSRQGLYWFFHGDNALLYDRYKIPIKPINNHIGIKYKSKYNQWHTVSHRTTIELLDSLIHIVAGKQLMSEEYDDGLDFEEPY